MRFLLATIPFIALIACSNDAGPGDPCEGNTLTGTPKCPSGYFCDDHADWTCQPDREEESTPPPHVAADASVDG